MRAKLSVLRASHRLLRPHGRLAFFTIRVAPDLAQAAHRRAIDAGPPAPYGPDLTEALQRVGFVDVREVDVTADYLETAQAWRAARIRHRDDLRPVDPQVYDERLAQGGKAIAAIEAGLLRRTLHLARAP